MPPSEIIRTLNHVLFYVNLSGWSELIRAALTDLGAVCFDIPYWVVSRVCQASVCFLTATVCFNWLQTSYSKNTKCAQDKQAKKKTEGQGDCYKRPAVMRFPMLCKLSKKLSNLYNTLPTLSIPWSMKSAKLINLVMYELPLKKNHIVMPIKWKLTVFFFNCGNIWQHWNVSPPLLGKCCRNVILCLQQWWGGKNSWHTFAKSDGFL